MMIDRWQMEVPETFPTGDSTLKDVAFRIVLL